MLDVHTIPTFAEERLLEKQGYRLVAGVDEAGRGALAGPVVAAAVILPCRSRARWLKQVRDSKLLNAEQREGLVLYIQKAAVSFALGVIENDFIDSHGLGTANRLAMKVAIEQLAPQPEHLLVDYFNLPEVVLPQKGITDGDALCLSISCASILAKVARDSIMVRMEELFPGYGFARHKGYGTPEHLGCLRRLGPSPIHRLSFRPVGQGELPLEL